MKTVQGLGGRGFRGLEVWGFRGLGGVALQRSFQVPETARAWSVGGQSPPGNQKSEAPEAQASKNSTDSLS